MFNKSIPAKVASALAIICLVAVAYLLLVPKNPAEIAAEQQQEAARQLMINERRVMISEATVGSMLIVRAYEDSSEQTFQITYREDDSTKNITRLDLQSLNDRRSGPTAWLSTGCQYCDYAHVEVIPFTFDCEKAQLDAKETWACHIRDLMP